MVAAKNRVGGTKYERPSRATVWFGLFCLFRAPLQTWQYNLVDSVEEDPFPL